jgi:Protein of unknown function (DUF1579)
MKGAWGWKSIAAVVMGGAMLFSVIGNSKAQEQKAALPLPEMQRLAKLYVGTWNYTESYPKSAFYPSGGVNSGVYTSELGPGGNSVINRFKSKGPVGASEGLIVMTWDAKAKGYKAYVFGDSFTGAVVQTGEWENDVLMYRSEMIAGATKIELRNVTKFGENGKLTSDEYSRANGGAEQLLVHVEAVKQ